MSKGSSSGTKRAAEEAPKGACRDDGRIIRVVLEEDRARPAALTRDVEQAVADLAADSVFRPRGLTGPFVLHLSLTSGRLVFDIRDAADAPLNAIGLALGPFRSLVKDYLMIVESHAHAAGEGRTGRVEAIDMGRRGLHNEGATLVVERLHGKVDIDFETGRRLFTLVCVLLQRF